MGTKMSRALLSAIENPLASPLVQLQAFFLVADDVMDGSITRRSQPCWYKLPKVGLIAINDGFLIQSHIYKFLKSHFGKEAYYVNLLELFTEVSMCKGC
jgi:farnesyl diphosphate synthase